MTEYNIIYIILLCTISTCHLQETLQLNITTDFGEIHISYERSSLSCQTLNNTYGEECKYYGECCQDPVRIRERLETGTFECQNIETTQGYVVNKCPVGTDPELANVCSKENVNSVSDLSLSSWPVTGTYTGITYGNLYCAICNGALSPVTDKDASEVFDPQKAVEFWTMQIYCDNSTIVDVENEEVEVTAEVLQKLLQEGRCQKVILPTTQGIHRENCGRDIYQCPEEYPEDELNDLCKQGPPDEVCVDGSGYPCRNGSYRNMFCKMCWENQEFKELQPNFQQTNGTLLLAVKPLSHPTQNETFFSEDNFRIPATYPQYFLSLTNDDVINNLTKDPGGEKQEFWNLGSILCYSNYSTVCGEFIVFPKEKCSSPGCGQDYIQDLWNNCAYLYGYVYNREITLARNFLWADSLLGQDYSSCLVDSSYKNCRCDPQCHHFGECCYDAVPLSPEVNRPITTFDQSRWTCYEPNYSNIGMAVIDSCPDNTTEEAGLCARGNIGHWDPFSWMVSDGLTRLTYKNMYCASCNHATNLTFWDMLIFCSTASGEVGSGCYYNALVPPTEKHDLYYPCHNKRTFVSSCPEGYNGWQLSKDCETMPTSFVYYKDRTYINYYCAICHLGDELQFARITPDEYSTQSTPLVAPPPPSVGENNEKTNHTIRFSYNSNSCCGKCNEDITGQCFTITGTDSVWGSMTLPGTNDCPSAPFNTSCSTNLQELPLDYVPNTDFNYLCPGVSIICESLQTTTLVIGYPGSAIIHGGDAGADYIRLGQPGQRTKDPPVSARVFSDQGIREDEAFDIVNTVERLTANESFQFCSDGTIVSNTNGSGYNRILLSTGGIQVDKVTTAKEKRVTEKEELKLYDFILIGLSLAAILVYLVYLIATKRKTFRLPDKMMIALLVSLFGALICFALITTPAGSDIIGCQVLAALVQYFFLAALTWSNSMAISILKSIQSLRLSGASNVEFVFYSLYSCGVPLICTIVTYILSTIDIEAFTGEVYETEALCFLGERIVLYSLFLAPIYVIIVCNFIIGIIVMVKVARSGKVGASQDQNRTKKNVISCFKISVSLGLGWVLLFVATFYEELWPVMQVFVELQGVFIVISNLIRWNCIQSIKKWSESSATANITSTANNTTTITKCADSIELTSKASPDHSE